MQVEGTCSFEYDKMNLQMKNRQEKIYSILKEIALEMGAKDVPFSVEIPKDKSHGDLASNIALVLYKNFSRGPAAHHPHPTSSHPLRALDDGHPFASPLDSGSSESGLPPAHFTPRFKNPMELAQEILNILNTKYLIHDTDFDKIEIAAPGFINFYFSQKFLASQVNEIINQNSKYGQSDIGKALPAHLAKAMAKRAGRQGKKASVEFVSANPTGPLHIGNARGGPLGDAIANVLSKAGYGVTREYLHNDVGGQVTKLGEAIYYTLNPDKKTEEEIQYQGDYIGELATQIEKQLPKDLSKEEFVEKAGQIAVEILLEEILEDCRLMGIEFDKITKESDLRKRVPEVLEKLKSSLKEKDGALWFAPHLRASFAEVATKAEQGFGGQANDEFLKDRETVVKKSNGEYTYFASDIVYHNEKMSSNDLVIDVLGSNHSGHVPRLQAVIKALGFNVSNFKVILYQFVRLKRGEEIVKMSKRAGDFVTAREVLDEVGKDAFRFFLLTPRSQTHMDFDLELAKERSAENPVFYIQYAYTRICSIFSKFQISNFKFQIESADTSKLTEKEEVDLIRNLIQFPNLV
ncbi:MAG: arginine--tRNA ligase, partial [Candidatus Levybacteria bacterium CG10_big_fil_rev_8_21_14_0_10_35_13]